MNLLCSLVTHDLFVVDTPTRVTLTGAYAAASSCPASQKILAKFAAMKIPIVYTISKLDP